MKREITLKKDFDIKLQNQITKHLTPKYVYLPIPNGDEIHSSIKVKKEEKITNQLISPVSGSVVGMKYCMTPTGSVKKCLAILNDYKETFLERHAMRKKMTKISLEQMLIELREFHYNDLSQKILDKKEADLLILNGIEDEPYVANEIFIGSNDTNMILETLDALKEIIGTKEIKIVIKNNDREGIESYSNFLGTYPQIDLVYVPDYYLLGREEYLKKYLQINSSNLILKPSELRIIYNTLKRRRYVTEHIFTISGNAITNPQIIEAKLGSSVSEIIKEYIHLKKCEYVIYVNGLMTGRKMDLENVIVTEELKSILFMQKENLEESPCINCGKCYQICPKGCNPREFLRTHNKKDIENCIDCGLCSYICPSFINLRKVIKGEENE